MTESTYSLFQRGRRHLRAGMAAQATVSLEKAKRREPDKASIREALGIAYFRIGRGFCVLLGVARGDGEEEVVRLAGKVTRLRIFPDDDGRFDRSIADVGGAALVVSQFTLVADTAKGNRPSFADAAPPEQAKPL